jgi:hypothetical protein
MCKRAIAIAFVFSLLTALPARATTINPGDTITVSLSALPSNTPFSGVVLQLWADPQLLFPFGFTMTVTLFDASNSQLGQDAISQVAFPQGAAAIPAFFTGSFDNTGHFVVDQISAPFDLTAVYVGASDEFGAAFDAVAADFVIAATIPLPATLPLFASGLGALGLLGWRRKCKRLEPSRRSAKRPDRVAGLMPVLQAPATTSTAAAR